MKKYIIKTLGCQMNQNDSEKLSGMIEEMGYVKTDNIEEGDLIIYNTCCVRENAESKLYGHIGELKGLKKKRPEIIIGICGCMMQQQKSVQVIESRYRHVDMIFGTGNLHKFPEILQRALTSNKIISETDLIHSEKCVPEGIPISRKDKVKAWVTIMYGCDNFCSYCIVPYVRGRERSRNPKDIIKEVKNLAETDYKEITLLGQNVNSYGKGLNNDYTFAKLLSEVNNILGIERIRFVTSHPKDLSDELIFAMRDCEKVCEYLHLPLQSGSSRILKDMNRKYNKNDYINLVKKVKNAIPGISLSTDIIVGFPGETDEDFEDTLYVLKQIEFDMVYSFIYSSRHGTLAAEFQKQVSKDVINRRFNKLLEVQNQIVQMLNDKLVGADVEVLVEGFSKENSSVLTGRTRTNKIVNFKGDESMIGKLIMVRIKRNGIWWLEGEIKENN